LIIDDAFSLRVQSYEKTRKMQKEILFSFHFRVLEVSLSKAKNFAIFDGKVTKSRRKSQKKRLKKSPAVMNYNRAHHII
jgi:hypothetical protein